MAKTSRNGGPGLALVLVLGDQLGDAGAQLVQPDPAHRVEPAVGHDRPLVLDHERHVLPEPGAHGADHDGRQPLGGPVGVDDGAALGLGVLPGGVGGGPRHDHGDGEDQQEQRRQHRPGVRGGRAAGVAVVAAPARQPVDQGGETHHAGRRQDREHVRHH
jgi:hypothetical protein